MYTAPDQVACWYKAARMTDTGDMELLAREPSLALLAGYAAGARRGEGRLVLLDGGAGGTSRTATPPRPKQPVKTFFNERGSCHAGPAAR